MMKQWLKTYLTLFVGVLAAIGLFNYFMDPLWCFKHRHSLQSHQNSFNERQQKINLIHFQPFDYNGLLIGSSRVTVHDPSTLPQNLKAFNIAFDAMRLYEFNEYIQYAKKANKKEFQYIIIGLDFTGITGKDLNQVSVNDYINTTAASGYKYKMLFAYDTLMQSFKNIKNSLFGRYKHKFKTYNENHIAHTFLQKPEHIRSIVDNDVKTLSPTNFTYDRTNYLDAIRELKQNNPKTQFIVFTTPIPGPVLNKLLKTEVNRHILALWLNDIYNEFGPFWHFFYNNRISESYPLYFVDAAHYTSEIANCINHKLYHQSCKNPTFQDFGIYISDHNSLDAIHK